MIWSFAAFLKSLKTPKMNKVSSSKNLAFPSHKRLLLESSSGIKRRSNKVKSRMGKITSINNLDRDSTADNNFEMKNLRKGS